MKKDKFKIISRLLKNNQITDDEAILLLETDKEYIYNYYRNYPYYPTYYPNYYNYGDTNSSLTAKSYSVSNNLDVNFSSTEEDNITVSDEVRKFIQELKSE